MLRSLIVADDQQFEALRPQWDDLLARCADANVFLSHEWLHSWWTSYRPLARLRILVLDEGGRCVAIAPMMLCRERRFGLPVRVLRFIGDGTWETDHMSFLLDEERRDAMCRRLFEQIEALPWDVAEFNQMPATSPTTDSLVAFAQSRWRVDVSTHPCPRIHLPASYSELLAALPSRFRTALRSSRRRLEESHRIEFGLHVEPDGLPAALDTLFENHAGRWHAKGSGGVFVDARRRDFYSVLSGRLLSRGWLRFYHLKVDGRVVAQQYCFGLDRTTMLLQEGFDITLAKENIGNALRGFVLEHLIKEGGGVYDFLAGQSRHKSNWANDNLDDLRIGCTRRTLYGRMIGALADMSERAKRILRPLRDRLHVRLKDVNRE